MPHPWEHSSDVAKAPEEVELEQLVRELHYRQREMRYGDDDYEEVERQFEALRAAGGLSRLIMEEYDNGAVNYW